MNMMACSRSGCNSKGCGRYSPVYGPICDSCFNELVDLGSQVDIASFLDSQAGEVAKAKRRKEYSRYYKNIFRAATF